MDSWIPSKLEPGLAATHSMPRSLRTWTIRSEPGLTAARAPAASAGGRTAPASRSICCAVGGGTGASMAAPPAAACCGVPAIGASPPAAAAPTAAVAAPFRNPRRFTLCLDVATDRVSTLGRPSRIKSRSARCTLVVPTLDSYGRVSGTASDLAPGRIQRGRRPLEVDLHAELPEPRLQHAGRRQPRGAGRAERLVVAQAGAEFVRL